MSHAVVYPAAGPRERKVKLKEIEKWQPVTVENSTKKESATKGALCC